MNITDELYQQVILEHNRHPVHFHTLGDATHKAEGFNPLCGDRYWVYVRVDEKDLIDDVSFTGNGCAISKASLSIMTESILGKSIEYAKDLFGRFHELVQGNSDNADDLGELAVFGGVAKYPARVKCAALGWHTLMGALNNSQDSVCTE
ncbi:MAG: SUF system NifU family Fe-S cluster assembly protein [Planctomycetes bacterium]|nr:SUF system NifU family Fe-S cluster assembly protein [Planctomycetota bacterium]